MIKKEFLRFLVVGCANTGSSFIVYLVFNIFFSYTVAYTIGYLVGLLVSYFLNANWVFKAGASWQSFVLFPLVYITQYVISVFLLRFIIESLGVNESIAFIPVVIATIPITFILSKIVFKLDRTSKKT